MIMIGRGWFLFLLFKLCLVQSPLAQQNSSNHQALRELILAKEPVHQIAVFRQFGGKGAIFWPDDLKEIVNAPNRIDHWVKTSQGLFVNPDGTGRLYKVYIENDSVKFKRIDETIFFGYNFHSFLFDSQDVIYSIGGYGFWRGNGILRFYDSLKNGWEMIPLNREILVGNELPLSKKFGIISTYAIKCDSSIYVVYKVAEIENQEYLKPLINSEAHTTVRIERLNLKSGDWHPIGNVKEKSQEFISQHQKIISLPFGEFTYCKSGAASGFYLLNLAENKIYKIASEKESILQAWLYDEKVGAFLLNQIIYSKDSTVVFIREDLKRLEITFTKSDFIDTEMKIYEPISNSSGASINFWQYAPLTLGFILSGMALFIIYKKRKTFHGNNGHSSNSKFTIQELELMQFLSEQSEHTATTEELNSLLGTTKKSTDVQKKVRSEITRAINEKYHDITFDEEKLIQQVRLESDKRMVKYVIDHNKYLRLLPLLPVKK
jgi:hypothetical protein